MLTTTEILKRVPTGHPFASGPADPALLPIRLALLGIYFALLGYQLWRVRSDHQFDARMQRFLSATRLAA